LKTSIDKEITLGYLKLWMSSSSKAMGGESNNVGIDCPFLSCENMFIVDNLKK
jgi:hypothetical protein